MANISSSGSGKVSRVKSGKTIEQSRITQGGVVELAEENVDSTSISSNIIYSNQENKSCIDVNTLGSGESIISSILDDCTLNIKSIKSGSGTTITSTDTDIIISFNSVSSDIIGAENLGSTGAGLYSTTSSSGLLQFKRLVAGNNISLTEDSNGITINSSDTSSVNITASNIGTQGIGLFDNKTSDILNFRNISSTNKLSLSLNNSTKSVIIDVNEGNISVQNLSGTFPSSRVSGLSDVAISGDYDDIINKPTLFSGDYNDLSNKPILFSGDYNNLTNKPVIPSSIMDLSDVNGVPLNGQILTYVNGTDKWRPVSYTNGTVTSVNAVGSNGISVTGGPITSSGSMTINLDNTLSSGGTFGSNTQIPVITVNEQGRITDVIHTNIIYPSAPVQSVNNKVGTVNLTLNDLNDVNTAGVSNDYVLKYSGGQWISGTAPVTGVSSVGITPGTGITVSGSPITSNGNITVGLSNSGVSVGTYGTTSKIPVISVDAKGRVTNVSEVNISPQNSVTSVNAVGSNGISVTGGPITSSGTFSVSLSNTGVGIGSYGDGLTVPVITVDSQGRLTNVTTTPIEFPERVVSIEVNGLNGISVTGSPITDIGSLDISLDNTGISSGSYGSDTKTIAVSVNSQGRITSISQEDINIEGILGYLPGEYYVLPSGTAGVLDPVSIRQGLHGFSISSPELTDFPYDNVTGFISMAGSGNSNRGVQVGFAFDSDLGGTPQRPIIRAKDSDQVSWGTWSEIALLDDVQAASGGILSYSGSNSPTSGVSNTLTHSIISSTNSTVGDSGRPSKNSSTVISSSGSNSRTEMSTIISSQSCSNEGSSTNKGRTIISSISSVNLDGGGDYNTIISSKNVATPLSTVLNNALIMGYDNVVANTTSSQNRTIQLEAKTGNIKISGALTPSSSFSDFAEFFENGIIGEIPLGTLVTLIDDKIYVANSGDYPIGVISATAGVLLGDSPFYWDGVYLKDEYGRILKDQDGKPQINPSYDPNLDNIPRSQRKDEWSSVGLLGQVYVNVDNTVNNGCWIKTTNNGIGTISENITNIKVMKITMPYDSVRGFGVAKCLIK